jgi:hypothetical protein
MSILILGALAIAVGGSTHLLGALIVGGLVGALGAAIGVRRSHTNTAVVD